jgi:hypothetical protein
MPTCSKISAKYFSFPPPKQTTSFSWNLFCQTPFGTAAISKMSIDLKLYFSKSFRFPINHLLSSPSVLAAVGINKILVSVSGLLTNSERA